MFASLLCNKGFKAVLKSDKIILSKNGLFIGKGYYCEGMFKLTLDEINKVKASSTYVVDSCYLWRVRLAHLNFKSLQYMPKHGYISFRHNDGNDKCEICI